MRRFLSCLLILSIIVTLSVPAFATDSQDNFENNNDFTFIDGEGKTNTVHMTVSDSELVHVDYYIEGVLINTADVELIDNDYGSNEQFVHIEFRDYLNNTRYSLTDPLSKYIHTSNVLLETPREMNAYSYQGKINYNTYYDSLGNPHNDKLVIYQQTGSTTPDYKMINVAEGTAASIAIGVIGSVLATIFASLVPIATPLLYAAATAAGTTIVGGIVQGAITKQYYCMITYYNVKACDYNSSRQEIYDAERYKVALSGGGYSSDYYYDGYLPWRSNAVAYWMFCDFWSYTYPGVNSYT